MTKVRFAVLDGEADDSHALLRRRLARPPDGVTAPPLGASWNFEANTACLSAGAESASPSWCFHGTGVTGIAVRGAPHAEAALLVARTPRAFNCAMAHAEASELPLVNWSSSTVAGKNLQISAGPLLIGPSGNRDRYQHSARDLWPTGRRASHLIVVAALDEQGAIASFSNHDPAVVHIAAPGSNVLTARAGGGFVKVSGTSAAAPQVTNAGVCVLGLAPFLSPYPRALRALLLESADHERALRPFVEQGRRLNLERALRAAYVLARLREDGVPLRRALRELDFGGLVEQYRIGTAALRAEEYLPD